MGEVAILNVGDGDTKLSFDPKRPEEMKRAKAAVTDMLRRGFAIMVEVGQNDKGPLYQRVQQFDPETAEYIIVGAPDPTTEETDVQKPASPPRRRAGRKAQSQRIPATSAKVVAVAPIAGG